MNCPICGQPVDPQHGPYRPFCSERCKLIDFGRWANEEYRVPGQALPSNEAETPEGAANDGLSSEEE